MQWRVVPLIYVKAGAMFAFGFIMRSGAGFRIKQAMNYNLCDPH
jgi:hypothetical protein